MTDGGRVAIVFTGGTIAMRVDPAAGGAVPILDGQALLDLSPGLSSIAELEPIDWGRVPASHLSFDQLLELARLVQAALDRPEIGGAVVVQGTDTIEETAFAFDLLLAGAKPVVVTGSMRNADEPGYEGPANLRDSVRCAASHELRGQGTLVVLGGRILPADDATKTDTDSIETFRALNDGALGRASADGLQVTRARRARRQLPHVPEHAVEPVALVTAAIGVDGWPVELALRGGARGVVIAATGAGNTHPGLLAACRVAMEQGVPVVLTTRAASGRARAAYGFPGGGVSWVRAGAMLAGSLGGVKARVALALGLGAGLDDAGLRKLLAG